MEKNFKKSLGPASLELFKEISFFQRKNQTEELKKEQQHKSHKLVNA